MPSGLPTIKTLRHICAHALVEGFNRADDVCHVGKLCCEFLDLLPGLVALESLRVRCIITHDRAATIDVLLARLPRWVAANTRIVEAVLSAQRLEIILLCCAGVPGCPGHRASLSAL